MSLLSSLDYDFGMCKPIWKIIDGYFTIPKIKDANPIGSIVTGRKIEISFEDKDCTPFQLALDPKQELFGFAVLQEWKCIFWVELMPFAHCTCIRFHTFNLELLEEGMSRWYNSSDVPPYTPIIAKILKPEDELKQVGKYFLDDDYKYGGFPANRKSEILVVVERGEWAIAYSNWKFGRTDDPSWRDLKPVSV
jgi:hypothetical protein